jgi:diguanylate cyclase (GGDEF)-like protein
MTVTKRDDARGRVEPRRTLFDRAQISPLWRTPAKPLTLILAVEALSVTCLVAANVKWPGDLRHAGYLLLLFAMSAVLAESVDRVERLRRYLAATTQVFMNPTSVWFVAGAIVLPVGYAAALAALVGTHTAIRVSRHRAAPLYRTIYTAASDVLAASSAALAFTLVSDGPDRLLGGVWGSIAVMLAIVTYWTVNGALISGVIWLTQRPDRPRDLLMSPDEELLEVATLCLGAGLAITMLDAPAVAPLVLVVMVVLRRSALVRQLQEQATHDTRTGLLNSGAWRQEAERELARSARSGDDISLLMIDLDHFKVLNDTHGHQAGDRALKAVADCLTETLRGYDAVGRYGGEEFAALLVDADELTGEAVAERVCAKIREIELADDVRVTASIGVATAAASRTDLDALVSRADAALYVAKNRGRDRVSPAPRQAAHVRAD